MSGRTSSSSDNKQALSELTEWKGELTDFSDVQYGKRSSAEAVSTVPLAGAWGERYSPQKRILLVKNVVCLVSCSAALPFAIFAAGDGGSREYVITAALGVAILTTIASLCRLLPSDESAFDNALYEMWWVECQFYVYAMCLGAIELADPRTSVWPFFLLQIETAFLMPMPARTVKVLFLVVVSVLVVKHANEIFDFDRNGIENSAISVELSLLMLGLELVFLCCGTVIAYHAQRELIKRTATLTHTISSVHTTARCIKKFDLDAADTLLNMDSELPLETHVSLREIIDSLRAYQPFIPAMCLPRPSDVEDVVIHAPKIPPHEEEEIKLGWSLSDRDFLGGSPLLHYDVQSVVSPPARSVRRSRVSINTATTSETTASTLFSPSASSKGAKTVHSPLRASVCSSRGMLPVPSKGNSLMKWQLAAAAARKNYLHLSHGNITVLHTNLHDSIAMMTDLSLYELTFTRFLESAWAACTQHKGVVDFFVGDRIFISFNASRACLRHQKRAANVATHLIESHPNINFNASIVTGGTVFGDVGCKEIRRYTILGFTPIVSLGLERMGRAFGCKILCNAACEQDINFDMQLRIVPRGARFMRQNHPTDGAPYEEKRQRILECNAWELVCTPTKTDAPQRVEPEWMYEMEANAQVWSEYNKCIREYLAGSDPEALKPKLDSSPQQVKDFFDTVMLTYASTNPFIVYA